MDEMTDFRAEEKEAEQAQKEQIAEEQAQVMIDAKRHALLQNAIGIGGALGPQFHWSPEQEIRNTAFSYAWQNCGRSADYEEIIRVARAFESYLKGESNV
ncbi:MAG TPA: hypothetical protein VKA94_17280 [Hyphomicrobiales bacterium]|nr:hypothetical protein [Hyphomicrobiales bacterium]